MFNTNANELTAVEKDEHRKMLQRERAKRYYAKNKEKVLEKNRLTYAINHGVDKLVEDDNELITELKKIIKEHTNINPTTGDNIINASKVWCKVLKINTIVSFKNKITNNPFEVIDRIDTASYGNDNKDYSSNSKRNYLAHLFNICDAFEITLTKKSKTAYQHKIDEFNLENTKRVIKRNDVEKETLPTFDEYIERVKQIYPENSLQMLLILLYSELTCRDDYGRLIIIDDTKKATGNKNYIFVGKRDIKIIIHQFKTAKVYKKIQCKLSYELANKVKSYITANKMNINDELFPYDTMSHIICDINKKIGVEGGINTLRRIAIKTELTSDDTTAESQQKLADTMGHTLRFQQTYYTNPIIN